MTHNAEPGSNHFLSHDHPGFSVTGLPAFNDNYIWLVRSTGGQPDDRRLAVVDPGDAAPVIEYCRRQALLPDQIWLTHHHADHMGGVTELRDWVAGRGGSLAVYGPAAEAIPGVTKPLDGGECLSWGEGLGVKVMRVPGHTRGHLAYYVSASADIMPPALFCGDTLFGLGCGRLFEGTASQMFESLKQIARLPSDTCVYCAHEYTLLNLPFALAVDRDNVALAARAEKVRQQRRAGEATVPFTLAEELATNPFLRCDQSVLRQSAMVADGAPAVAVFTNLRRMRDTFKVSQ